MINSSLVVYHCNMTHSHAELNLIKLLCYNLIFANNGLINSLLMVRMEKNVLLLIEFIKLLL